MRTVTEIVNPFIRKNGAIVFVLLPNQKLERVIEELCSSFSILYECRCSNSHVVVQLRRHDILYCDIELLLL